MVSVIDGIKQFYSMGLVIFSVVIVTALMFTENTKVAADAHPVVALVTMWLGILWMSMVEAGQCSIDHQLIVNSTRTLIQSPTRLRLSDTRVTTWTVT